MDAIALGFRFRYSVLKFVGRRFLKYVSERVHSIANVAFNTPINGISIVVSSLYEMMKLCSNV
jgi:hypothetical protein